MSDTPCEPWPKACNSKGYGVIKRHRQMLLAHRWVWEQAHGPIPDGMWVLHHCDNPPCVALDHLFLGTPADNFADMVAKGRRLQEGEQSHLAKLTREEVAQIRAAVNAGEKKNAVAARFGISSSQMTKITQGKSWKTTEEE